MIYHITPRSAWETAQSLGQYATAALITDGFIHCSDAPQVARVANALFQGQLDLVLLTIDPTQLMAEVRYEQGNPPSPERFPHCYGSINLEAVVAVEPLVALGAEGHFAWPPSA